MFSGTDSTNQNELVVVRKLQAGQLKVGAYEGPVSITIDIAASSTTDGMDITVTVLDQDGVALAAVFILDLYMSESAAGIGVTADTYSGDLTASVGAILSALTAKKHWRVATAATGIFTATLVDSGNPADQYAVAVHPTTGQVALSVISGANWEGA